MRRILTRYAKPTMLLGRSIHDGFGKILLKEGSKLSANQVASLEEYGVGELVIVDKRVNDVTAWPLITPELEGSTAQALKQILQKTQYIISREKGQVLDLSQLRQFVVDMTKQLFPAPMGEPVIVGCHSIKDYDYVHPVKATSLSLLIGKAAGLGESELLNLGMASLLQNIGYAALQQGVVDKLSPLTEAEAQAVRQHAAYGAEIISKYGQLPQETVMIIRQHHERWNGSGYPDGLKTKDICEGARILAITDSVVALVSQRPHRGCILPKEAQNFVNAFSGELKKADFLRPRQAMEFIVAYSGELFDPDLVKIFANQLPTYPSGVMVKLNTGEVGIVSNANRDYFSRPKVRICYDRELRDINNPVDINLADAEHQLKLITETMEY